MKKINVIRTTSLAVSCALLAACATPPMYYNAQDNVAATKTKISQSQGTANQQMKVQQGAVEYKNSMYVDNAPINLAQEPAWLQKPISLHGANLPFSFYSQQLVGNAGIITSFQTNLQQNKKISLSYSGTVEGALKALAAKTGYLYKINGNQIYWQEYITKTFNIAFLPGDSSYMVGKQTGGDSAQNSGGGGGSDQNATVVQGGKGNADNEYNNISGKMSVWSDIQKTVKSMLSPKGTVIVSESTTSITVHDTPERVQAIHNYIKSVNADLFKEVMVKVQVLDIKLNKSFNYGINWQVAASFISKSKFVFNGNFSQPVSISPLSGTTAAGVGVQKGASSALINALSQQGTVSISTEPTIVTTNNQVASINLLSQVGYLAKISNTTSDAQSQGGQTETTITPGQVSTGFTLYLLPKIIDNKIYMQLSSDLSSLLEIRNLYSSGQDQSSSQSQGGSAGSMIQVPDINSKSFNQRSIVKSGTTLILAGFKQMTNRANNQKMFGVDALGGRGAQQQDEETIVLVTPYILNNK